MTQSNHSTLTATFPRTPLSIVERLARAHFGIAGTASTLSSERDETFQLKAGSGETFILKIASPEERIEILQFQADAMAHLSGKRLNVPVPRPLVSAGGTSLVSLPFGDRMRTMLMLTFLEGDLIHTAPRSTAQMRALGTALAELGAGLADFHPVVPQQELIWDLCHAANLRQYVPFVDPARRGIVEQALDAHERLAASGARALRRQVIHNDFNPHNILVSPSDPDQLTGVIDFGDIVEAPLVNDLAVALSYQVAHGTDLDDVLALLRAYCIVRPLSSDEIDALPTLLRMRLAMTITITEWRSTLQPDNSTYILRNHAAALAGLAKLAGRSDADLANLFHRVTGDSA